MARYVILLLLLALRYAVYFLLISDEKIILGLPPAVNGLRYLVSLYNDYRVRIIKDVYTVYCNILPSPHSELLLGVVVGSDSLDKVQRFREALRVSGVIHVVVVSGYNMSLVVEWLQRVIGGVYKKRTLLAVVTVTFLYTLLTGFEPPVVRAWVMSAVSLTLAYYGRRCNGIILLLYTCYAMLLVRPPLITSLSFLLTFLSSLGILLYSDRLGDYLRRFNYLPNFIKEDFSVTIAAQTMVWCVIAYKFGNISIVGVITNTLLVWTIPIITILGFAITVPVLLFPKMYYLTSMTVYPLADIFVQGVRYFSSFNYASIEYRLPLAAMMSYYAVLLAELYCCRKRRG